MAGQTHETASTQFVDAEGIRFAYRRFGKAGGIPLVFLQYFNANMDDWDPAVVNGFAADHDVVLFDNAGVASSSGETPSTVSAMALHCVAFCRALGFAKINVMGFSLGGMVAQQLACDYPDFVERLILLGTGPRGGEGMTFTELSAEEQADPVSFLLAAFFTSSEESQAAGRAFMDRMAGRHTDRDLPVSTKTAAAQLIAIREWGAIPASDRYSTLKRITHPVLIVHGNRDIVVMPINAFILAEHLPNAELIIYPDSSHGAQYQHAQLFLKHAMLFFLMENDKTTTSPEQNKALVLKAFDTLFNKRDYDAAERFWSNRYIQHSAHIPPGRNGLFDLVRALPDTLRYENRLILAEGDYVIAHGRFSGHGRPAAWIAADVVRFEDGKLAEHWDVLQDEATEAQSVSGLPMFGDRFPV